MSPLPAQPLDSNYKPVTNDLYDPVGKQFASAQAGTTVTSSDGTVYASTITQPTSPYPLGATPLTAASGNVANAIATATLAAAPAGHTTYITGFAVTGAGITATGAAVSVTVTNVITGTLTYTYTAAIGAQVANTPLIIHLPYPLPANATATAIVVTCPALGTGNLFNAVDAYGFTL